MIIFNMYNLRTFCFILILIKTTSSTQNLDKWTTYNGHIIFITTYFNTKPQHAIDLCTIHNMELIYFEDDDAEIIFQEILEENQIDLAWGRNGVNAVPHKFRNSKSLTRKHCIPFVICVENSLELHISKVITEAFSQ